MPQLVYTKDGLGMKGRLQIKHNLAKKQSRSRSFEKSSKDQINYEMSSMRFHKGE
ncbi:unnamed protein product [Brassica oleracea var. botrytis]|uniref:(rape) hypothetical protein n=1 Tax=Brassica napus TaxID=3708 RepID=A0A816J2Y1_BRANA|nr:unnamed protein product [Brassica napus]